VFLEQTDEILSGPSASSSRQTTSKFSEQPRDITEGAGMAIQSFSRNLGVAKERGDGGVAGVVRGLPVVLIGASEAITKGLIGGMNSLESGKKEREEDKYKQG
jgi:hypothetical protein